MSLLRISSFSCVWDSPYQAVIRKKRAYSTKQRENTFTTKLFPENFTTKLFSENLTLKYHVSVLVRNWTAKMLWRIDWDALLVASAIGLTENWRLISSFALAAAETVEQTETQTKKNRALLQKLAMDNFLDWLVPIKRQELILECLYFKNASRLEHVSTLRKLGRAARWII